MFTRVRLSATALPLIIVALTAPWSDLRAQTMPRLFEAPRQGGRAPERSVRMHQARKARLRLEALNSPSFVLNLFDNTERVARRTRVEQPKPNQYVWHGKTDDEGFVTFAVVDGVATGTVFLDGRSFEITMDSDGDYTIAELNAAAFPTEDEPLEAPDVAYDVASTSSTTTPTVAADGATLIDVMVVWTPAARAAAGWNVRHSEPCSVVGRQRESGLCQQPGERPPAPGAQRGSRLRRDAYLYGWRPGGPQELDGWKNRRRSRLAKPVRRRHRHDDRPGLHGRGLLRARVPDEFSEHVFFERGLQCRRSVVLIGAPLVRPRSRPQPGTAARPWQLLRLRRRVPMPMGTRIPATCSGQCSRTAALPAYPYLSNPAVIYNGRVTGTSSQNNARALNDNIAIVSAFKSTAVTTPCSYTVSPGSFSFSNSASTASVTVTTTSNCAWSSSSGVSWATVSGSRTGSGTAVVSVTANGGGSRSANLLVAGKNVTVSQAAACTYTVSPDFVELFQFGLHGIGDGHDDVGLCVELVVVVTLGNGHR